MKIRLARESDAPALAALRWEFRTEGGEPPAVPYAEFSARYAEFFGAGLAAGERGHVVAEAAGPSMLSPTKVLRAGPAPLTLLSSGGPDGDGDMLLNARGPCPGGEECNSASRQRSTLLRKWCSPF